MPTREPVSRPLAASPTASEFAGAVEVLPASEGKYVIDVKVLESGSRFRLRPLRDPLQPRLWCVTVRQCSSNGALGPDGATWIDRPGVAWADICVAIEELREDLAGWMIAPSRAALCRWILTAPPLPSVAEAAGVLGALGKRADR